MTNILDQYKFKARFTPEEFLGRYAFVLSPDFEAKIAEAKEKQQRLEATIAALPFGNHLIDLKVVDERT